MKLLILHETKFQPGNLTDIVARIHAGESLRSIGRHYGVIGLTITKWIERYIKRGKLDSSIYDIIKQNASRITTAAVKEPWNPERRRKQIKRAREIGRNQMNKNWKDLKWQEKHAATIKKHWEDTDYWEWVASFPLEKGLSIIAATVHSQKWDNDTRNRMMNKLRRLKG